MKESARPKKNTEGLKGKDFLEICKKWAKEHPEENWELMNEIKKITLGKTWPTF